MKLLIVKYIQNSPIFNRSKIRSVRKIWGRKMLGLGRSLLLVLLAFTSFSHYSVYAITPLDVRSINTKTAYYDPNELCEAPQEIADKAAAGASLQTMLALPMREKLGQLLVVGFTDKQSAKAMAAKHQLGGIYLEKGANSLFNKAATDEVKKAGKLPVLVAVDQEGGRVQRLDAVGITSPSAKQLGSMSASEIITNAKAMAQKMAALGVTVDFAPVIDLDDGRNPIISGKDRAFHSSPDVVAEKALAFAQGLRDGGVTPVFKHFPGHGSADKDSHVEPTTTPPLDQLKAKDLKPYEGVQASGTSGVMVGHLIVPGLTNGAQATISKPAIDLLRNGYKFDQVVFSDEIANMKAIISSHSVEEAVSLAIQAGVDMPIFNHNKKFSSIDAQITAILDRVEADLRAGKITEAQINQSLTRIARFKGGSQPLAASPAPGAPAPAAPGTPPATGAAAATKGTKIYIIGDSLTVGMRDGGKLEEQLKADGWQDVKIDAKGGEPLKWGIDTLRANSAKLKAADTLLVNLGTNNSGHIRGQIPAAKAQMEEIVKVAKDPGTGNPNIKIFWTDFFGKGTYNGINLPEAYKELNRVLGEVAKANGIPIVPYSTATHIHDALNQDGLHPYAKWKEFSALIVETLRKGGGGAASTPKITGASCCSVPATGSSTPIPGSENFAKVYNYLIGKTVAGKPLQDFHIAGILGNMQHESGVQEQRLQGTPSGTVTLAENVPRGQKAKAYGLVQWDPAHKMIDPVKGSGKNPNDMAAQLDFLLEQLNGGTPSAEKRAGQDLMSQTDVAGATFSFETKYERHAGGPQPKRITAAQDYLAKIRSLQASGGAQPTPSTAPGGAPTPAPGAPSGGIAPTVIALDPGHGGAIPPSPDPDTGLIDRETPNSPEREDVLDVSNRVKTALEQAGYKVIMLRTTPDQQVSKRERVKQAESGGAQMAVSIHTTPGAINEVWPQFVGGYRQKPDGSKVTFSDQRIADLSRKYSEAMAQERTKTEGHQVTMKNGFNGAHTESPGNLPLVQLWSKIPWVYNEIGHDSGTSISDGLKQKYADGIINGIKKANPAPGAGQPTANDCAGALGPANTGDLNSTVLSYAWPDYRGSGYVTMKPEYKDAINRAIANRQYVGGIKYRGVDCGGFTTRVMIDSNFAPNFNHGGSLGSGASFTGVQLAWVRANWQSVGRGGSISTADLRPGDVAFRVTSGGGNDGHTFMYAGDIPGFGSKIASASLDDRAPMAGRENPMGGNIEWFRKK